MGVPVSLETFLADPRHVDCATAVMLKILDGKCKMSALDKLLMEDLYDRAKDRPGQSLTPYHHSLIKVARAERNQGILKEARKEQIYEERLYAETMIGRPTMKAFKAALRAMGFLPPKTDKIDLDTIAPKPNLSPFPTLAEALL